MKRCAMLCDQFRDERSVNPNTQCTSPYRRYPSAVLTSLLILLASPAHAGWVVADNWRGDDRPLYACDAQCVADRDRGGSIGRVAEGVPCDGQLNPAWESRGDTQWQFVSGGLAVCEFVGEPDPVMDVCMQICAEEVTALCD